MNLKSEYFKTATDLVEAKDDAYRGVKDRKDRLTIIRRFTNMMNTLTEKEAEELGRTEITNHGLAYRAMLQNEMQYTSMVSITNALLEVIVDTDDAEKDLTTGFRISEAINRGAIHHKGKFLNFWRKVAGELVLAGGCPVTQQDRYGWLPELRPDMFFPRDTSLDAEQFTYCFDPKELTMSDLKKMQAKAESGNYINKKNIDLLIERLKKQIADKIKVNSYSSGGEISRSTRDTDNTDTNTTIKAWWYYELKYDKKGDRYVSSTLFTDGVTDLGVDLLAGNDKSKTDAAQVIAYVDKADESVTDWLQLVCVDSEIGGIKNLDTLKGVAEQTYASNVDMEELLNLIIEGEKIRARPKVRLLENANPDDVAKWNMLTDLYAPAGVEEMQFKTSTNGLQGPLAILQQNSAGMSTSSVANGPGGGELRQQALERQQNSSALQTNRIAEAYNHLDTILETVVYRILTAPVKPGTDGYHEIMWIRSELDKYQIPYKALASRKHGRFQYLRVRAQRTIGNGDRVQQLATADWLMERIQNYEPAARPMVLHRATTLHTQDPDLADYLVKLPKAIINAQKITAENEYDTIRRRAALGQTIPVAQDDIHQDHIPIHLLDMSAHLASHGVRPWDRLDVLVFAGASEHVGQHIEILMTNPVTAPEAPAFIQDYQNIVQAAQKVVEEVQTQQGDAQNQLTPKEQADLQIAMAKLELEGRKFGFSIEAEQALQESRMSQSILNRRKQYAKEVTDDKRLKLDAVRVKQQGDVKKAQKKNASK